MSTIVEKIKDIEKEMARTQINKATMSHLCTLRAKLAKLRTQLLEPPKGSAGPGEGFEVERVGDARVALIGFPSVGKSTILSTFTTTKSECAAYEFTTLTCIPGATASASVNAAAACLTLPSAAQASFTTRTRGSSCSTCPESLKAPRRARAVAGRSSPWRVRPTWCCLW